MVARSETVTHGRNLHYACPTQQGKHCGYIDICQQQLSQHNTDTQLFV